MDRYENLLDLSSLSDDPGTKKQLEVEITKIFNFEDVINRLTFELKEFSHVLKAGLTKNEFIDVKLAEELAQNSSALLEICLQNPAETHVPYVLAAISYFVRSDDGKDDFTDIEGFEDDKRVLNLVIETFDLRQQLESKLRNTEEKKSA